MSSDRIIEVTNISKVYQLYNAPADRLKLLVGSRLPGIPYALRQRLLPTVREFWALHDISLDVERGKTLGVVGQNGSGKSTLLQIICGTLTPTGGSVAVNGRISAILELGAGFNPEFTGLENIRLSASIYGFSQRQIADKLPLIADFADIGIHIEQPVKTYSSGMYARLAFAVAIHVDPDILVVDEALAVGDEAFQRKCFARLEALKRNGVTIMFVSHSGGTIVQLCDRAILLHRGRKVFDGDPKQAVFYHQKIGNAGHEREEEVLQEIQLKTLSSLPASHNDEPAPLPTLHEIGEGSSAERAFFDASLVSKSKLVYDPDGAEIIDYALIDANYRPVNVISKGGTYTVTCRISVINALRNVRFYTVIRTINGLDIAGCAHPALGRDSIDLAHPGTYRFDVQFECLLNPGTYFISFALQAADGRLHHRVIDALPVRVNEERERSSTALVDLKFASSHNCIDTEI